MNCLLFYNGKDPAFSIWNTDINACTQLVHAMKKDGWNVVWTVHGTSMMFVREGYEDAYNEWEKLQ